MTLFPEPRFSLGDRVQVKNSKLRGEVSRVGHDERIGSGSNLYLFHILLDGGNDGLDFLFSAEMLEPESPLESLAHLAEK